MPKVAKKAFNIGQAGTQYVSMVTKLLNSYCEAQLVKSRCKELDIYDKNWLRRLFSSFMMSSLG